MNKRLGVRRSAVIALLTVVTVLSVGVARASADHNVEHRIAQFWARLDAMQPGDYLSAADLGQWALNVIERDPRARLTVADFRASTAMMQAAFDRAGPAPVPAPPPTRAAPFKIGDTVRYQDGWSVTVVRLEEMQSSSTYIQPKAGMRFVAVVVKIENGSTRAHKPNPFHFKLQDSIGVRRDTEYVPGRNDALTSSELAPGAFTVGSVTFSAPIGDTKLKLLYEDLFVYKQATWELY